MQFGPPHTPPIIKQLMIACLAVFIGQHVFGRAFTLSLAVIPELVWQHGWIWQPFTYMWLHSEYSLLHIAMNMFMLWMFGSPLAMAWGPRRFLRYYLVCGVGAGFLIATVPYALVGMGIGGSLSIPTLGASGAIYGIVLAYSLTWPERTIMLIFPPVAFKAIWLIPGMVAMSLLFGPGNISHVGHLGGAFVGWLYLRREGTAGNFLSLGQLKYRWRRYRMKQKLRAVQYEDFESQRRRNEDDDRRYH